jgi:hypothetical protein
MKKTLLLLGFALVSASGFAAEYDSQWRESNQAVNPLCKPVVQKQWDSLNKSDIALCGPELLKYAHCSVIVRKTPAGKIKQNADLAMMYADCSDFMRALSDS